MEDVTVDTGRPLNARNMKRMGVIEKIRKLSSSLPQTSLIYTHSEPSPSITKPSETPTSNQPSPPLQKFNLTTTTLPISEEEMFNEPISPPSSTPSPLPYYTICYDPEPADPQSPTTSQLQARALSTHHQSEPKANIPSPSEQPTPPSEPLIETPFENPIIHNSESLVETTPTPLVSTSPTPKLEPTFPTLEETITLFAKSLVEKIRSLSENYGISDDPSARRPEDKAGLEEEQRAREDAKKVAAEAEAKAKADAEEAAHIAAEEVAKARNDALT
ncbi:uncharacterized protein LOC127136987 [Lathyrus oleraceus]|uniref:uncharacterized protein LOC127136987 n=1 Tax=Pisum sativum TaxID=3888 RepID=UPI0021D0B75E|nr:uncharacterized protein LOC127136987 [Pisum sativum]